ncbi:TPA: toprim domain-containing protein [Streptococcus suis]|uniref:PBECR4 domain-containing protein n=1 Tax=Streptococcus suis TaxID=1307 RepID=UPI00209BD0E4|nr:PBECR4 domain-containing protein [Streptococcus suis]MCO8202829.1 PBECR4 domain-containing protein [Streptococcus suis]HEM3503034.1 toprim domain-containing protein [Streptococcus suis]
MVEEHTQQPSSRGKSRRERVEYARSRDILDVANELNIELVQSGRDYRWKEHDSMVVSPKKNMWNWFSRHQGGDVIALVQTMKEVDFNQAIDFLNDGTFKEFTKVEHVQEPFSYYLAPYEQPFEVARSYLKDQRGLSDETIDFFFEKGVLAQANAKVNGSIEPVVVFKSLDFSGEIVGATLQGIEENWEKWPERGYAKNIVRNSDGIIGMHVDIGQPNRLIFAESAIDLMSYYELHRDNLHDVRLISMDGLKEAVVGRHVAQLQSEVSGRPLTWSHDQLAEGLQTAIDNGFFADDKHADWITLAVDNDEGGRNFIDSLREKGATVTEDLPLLKEGQVKTDWNDALKQPPKTITGKDEASSQDPERQPNLQIVFQSSGEQLILDKYEPGEIVPYDIFVKVLYSENRKRLEEATELPTFPVLHLPEDESGTWFGLLDENGNTIIERFRYDIGVENESISERLWRSIPSEYLEIAQQIDALFPKISFPEVVLEESGIPVTIYSEHQKIGTIDLDDLFNKGDLGSISDELGYGWAVNPSRMLAVINDETLNQVQVDNLIERMIENGISGVDLKQYLDNPEFSLKSYAETGDIGLQEKEKAQEGPSERNKKERMYQHKGSLQPEAEGSTSPVLGTSTFERSVTSRPTISSQYLNITIKDGFKSRKTRLEKSIDAYNLGKLNRRGKDIQEAAQFYLNELANSTIHYFTADNSLVQVNFLENNFMHLTGLKVVDDDATPEKVLHDFAEGGELSYDDIRLKATESPFDKIKVLPDLETVLQTDSFYFDSLQDIPRYQDRFDSLIKSDDSDLMLLFRMNTEDGMVPVSVFKARKLLRKELQEARKNEIVGIFRERGGQIEQIAINDKYISDSGQEMRSILESKQYEEAFDEDSQVVNVSSYHFNHTAYNDVDSLLKAGAAYLQSSEGQEWLTINPEYHSELVELFNSESATNKQRIEIMSEFGNVQVNGYDIVAGLGYSEALSSDAQYFDQNIADEITEMRSEEPVQTDVVSAEQFTQVLDAVYNVGAPEGLERIPEELHAAWTRYFSYAEEHGDDLGKIIATADGDQLLDKTSNLYQEWHQDQIYQNDYHVRLQWAEEWPEGPQIPFKETELVAYQTFIETLYEQNQAFYKRHQDSMAIVNETGNQEAYIPFTKVKFDIYAPGGTLIKSDVRYNIGDETEPISRLLGLGYRRLEGQPQLAAIDKQVLSQLENQEVNQEISTEANEQSLKATEIIPDESGHSRGNFHSPNEAMKVGLTQRVEEIMAEDAAKILVSSIPQIQESLSFEGNLIGTSQLDGRMLYINREDFGQDYHLELAVHSPMMIEQLSDTQAPWTLALIKGDEPLGYVAYGSDWGNDFQIAEELEKFAEQIGSERVPEGLYKQEEVDTFLATSQTNENTQKESKPATSDEPFDYSSATAYEISEHAFQKIREYTKSPEDMLEYMDFMSKFPQLSPRNVALIHDQWRGANVVATYDQWQAMGDVLGIKPEDVIQTKAVYTNKRTGETKEVLHQGLSVKTGEKSQITLFRPLMVKMIPVLDENGLQVKNDKGNPKYKKFSEASAQEKALVKEGKIPVRQFQERDPKTGQARFTTYKVFELSQTTLKPESYPKAMPNRHYNFNVDKVKTKEVLEGLCDYAESIGVKMIKDEARVLGNAKGAFFPGEQLILINPDNTPGEKIATTIHELAHATLHNPKLAEQYKENLPKGQKELEAEMTSHLLSKHFGLDTSEKAIDYIASWTKNLTVLDDKQLADSLKRIHKTVSTMLKQVETRTKPYQVGKMRGQAPNFPKAQVKGPSR